MGMFRDTHFVLQKNPQSKQLGVQETCTELCETVDVWITVSLPTFFREKQTVNFLQNEQCKILASLLDKGVENLDDHGCSRVENLVDEETLICSSYPFRQKITLHCAERKAKLFGN